MSIINNQTEITLAEKFRDNTLGSEKPGGMCFTMSYTLSLHLKNNGFDNEIIAGNFKDAGHIKNNVSHFWLTLTNNEEKIVDPTINQFYDHLPKLYFDERPDFLKATAFSREQWFKGTYDIWLFPFQNEHYLCMNNLNLKVLLRVNLKAATILYNESSNSNLPEHQEYFSGIKEIITRHWHLNRETIESLRSEMPDGFNSMLTNMLK